MLCNSACLEAVKEWGENARDATPMVSTTYTNSGFDHYVAKEHSLNSQAIGCSGGLAVIEQPVVWLSAMERSLVESSSSLTTFQV